MAAPRNINIVSITMFLIMVAGVYGSIQYLPYYWKKTKLEELVKSESYGARRKDAYEVTTGIVDRAEREMGIVLDPEEIVVLKDKDRVRVDVIWHFSVEHPLHKTTHHSFKVTAETVFY